MMTANRSFLKLKMIALTLAMPAVFGIRTWGQEAPAITVGDKQITGLPDDWSHRHVVFSNPGTEEEATHNGKYDEWLKIVNNPRYIMQQRMRGLPAQIPSGSDGADSTRTPNDLLGRGEEAPKAVIPVEEEGKVSPFVSKKKSKISIKKDWSMNGGAQTPASLTVTVGSNGASSSSTFTIDVPGTETLDGSAPVAEIGTFTEGSSAPSSGTSLVVAGVTYNFSSSTLSASQGNNTCGVEISTRSTTLNNLVGAMTAGASGSSKGTTTWECGTLSGVTANESSFSTSSETIHMTAITAGSVGFTYTLGSSGFTFSNTGSGDQAGSDGTNSATTFKYTTNSVADTAAQLAAELVTAINQNTAVTGVMSVTTTGSSGIRFQTYNAGTYSVSTNMTGITGTGSLSGAVLSTVQPNTYPAKYSFSTTTASCSDYVVYPTGFAGSTGQASIVAYSNLYKTTCSGSVPSVAWAYNTGGTTGLSPVLSLDGTQVAFVQVSSGGVASLVILKWAGSGGTVASPANITSETTSNYRGCTAPCYTTITFNGNTNDTNSSPYYNYPLSGSNNQDTIYVGDNSGYLHQFTGVFTGTPAEVTTNWPVHASTESSPALTGPVYDEGTSKLIFVGDASGYLHSVTTGSGAETVLTSNQNAGNTLGFVDAPVVDPNTEKVYTFTGYGGDASHNSYVNQYAAGTSISGSYGTSQSLGNGNSSTNPISSVMYAGAFDNTYYTGSGTTGHLYACENGALYQIPMSSFGSSVSLFNTPVGTASSAAVCSPVSEFDANASDDWLFVSVAAGGSTTANGITCTGACLYNYNAQGAGTTGSPVAAIASANGTGGIVIDNNLTGTGESQVYFDTQANQTCNGNGSTGSGSGICAVQASQAGLQ